jgi:transposase
MPAIAIPLIRHVEPEELRRLGRKQTCGYMAARMFAIANVMDGLSREDAATHAGMERQSLRDWVHRFNAEGVAGLVDRPRKGRPRRMHAGIEKAFCERVDKGPDADTDKLVRWRRVDLQTWLKSEHAINYHERSIGKILKRLGYSHVSTRPVHPQNDPEALEAFKKTLPKQSKRRFPNTPKTKPLNSGSKTKRGSGKKVR